MNTQSLQDIVDDLAKQLARPVAVNNFALDLLAASAQQGELDDYRVESIVKRHTPAAARTVLQARGVLARTEPFRLEADALPGLLPRMCIPIVANGFPIAFIWIVLNDDTRLTSREFQQAREAAGTIRDLLQQDRQGLSDELLGDIQRLHELLDADEYSSGYAAANLAKEGVDLESQPALVAVFDIVPDTQNSNRHEALTSIHANARRTWGANGLVGVVNGQLVLLCAARRGTANVRTAIKDVDRQLARVPFHLKGVGVSESTEWSGSLRVIYEEAVFAARIAGLGFTSSQSAHFADLGAFSALRRLPTTEKSVQLISPPAAALRRTGNQAALTTVLAYLENAGAVPATCQELAIHRTTLYYRLERAAEVIDDALQVGAKRTALHLGLLMGLLVDDAEHNRESTVER